MDWKKWLAVGLVTVWAVFMVGSCSQIEQRERKEMEEAERRVQRERPPVGTWSTEIFKEHQRDKP